MTDKTQAALECCFQIKEADMHKGIDECCDICPNKSDVKFMTDSQLLEIMAQPSTSSAAKDAAIRDMVSALLYYALEEHYDCEESEDTYEVTLTQGGIMYVEVGRVAEQALSNHAQTIKGVG